MEQVGISITEYSQYVGRHKLRSGARWQSALKQKAYNKDYVSSKIRLPTDLLLSAAEYKYYMHFSSPCVVLYAQPTSSSLV
jgi:hypothetical protein